MSKTDATPGPQLVPGSKAKAKTKPKAKAEQRTSPNDAIVALIKRVGKAMAFTLTGDAGKAKAECLAITKEIAKL